MKQISKTTVQFVLEQGKKLSGNLFTKKPLQQIRTEGLRYMPECISADVVQVSSKARENIKFLQERLSQLTEMRKSGMTHQAIAEYFGMERWEIQSFMQKYMPNVKKESVELKQAIEQYSLSISRTEQEQAFAIIDKHLQKIAKEEVKTKSGISYEDCLQDIRLRFLEILENRANKQSVKSRYVLEMLNKTETPVQQKVKTVGLDALEGMEEKLFGTDLRTEIFELDDYFKYASRRMSSKVKDILKLYLQDGESYEMIGKKFDLCPSRIQQIVLNAANRLKRRNTT